MLFISIGNVVIKLHTVVIQLKCKNSFMTVTEAANWHFMPILVYNNKGAILKWSVRLRYNSINGVDSSVDNNHIL